MKTFEPEDWKRVEAILDRVLEHPVDARAAVLAEVCAGDEVLRAQVEEMLKAGEEAASFLSEAYRERLLNELNAGGEDPDEERDWFGRVVGSYRLLDRIGRGGMGQVFRAVRTDEAFSQFVAVKVIRQGMDTAEVRVRFGMERQILASLNHPNIARLLDGGVTEDGISYLVMSYIEGVPITTYCNQRGLSVEERLELFQKVCSAVQYAHRNLIIHRDLKPSNILVTSEGTVKLLDFGIAKLLDPHMLGYTAPMTRSEMRIMTPEYASPEQVRGEQVTTASDVYALGVLLYELLTGQHPYPLKSLRRAELEQLICEVEPAPPSNAVGRSEEGKRKDRASVSSEAVSRLRGMPHERLRRRLAGDLDNIVMMSLRKEMERRYQSVEAFQEDIRRYLNGLPVIARPATIGYRMRKFIGRHQVGVIMAMVFVLLLFAVAMISIRFAVVTTEQARQIEFEAEKTRRVKQFLVKIFEDVDPMHAQGREMTANELLARGTIHIDGELMNQPEVRAEMLHVMGVVYRKLGIFDEAYRLLTRALDIRRAEYGDVHLEVANTLYELGWLVDDMGAYGEAEQLHREALAIRRKLLSPNHPDIAASLNDLGAVLYGKGDFAQAEMLFKKSLIIRNAIYSKLNPYIAESLLNLAVIIHDRGDYSEAEKLYEKAIEIQKKTLRLEDPSLTTGLISYASLLYDYGEYDRAESILREVLELRRGIFDEQHYYVAWAQEWLARVLYIKGQNMEAKELFYQVLEKRINGLGEAHILIARSMINLAIISFDEGKYKECEKLLIRSIDIIQKSVGNDHYYMANANLELGRLYLKLKRYREAELLLLKSLEYYVKWDRKKNVDENQSMLDQLYGEWEK